MLGASGSTPSPWTPSTTIVSPWRRSAPSAAAISWSGSFTPVDECTHVSASTLVRGVIARSTADTISSGFVRAGSRYRRTRRTRTPSRAARSRSASWVA